MLECCVYIFTKLCFAVITFVLCMYLFILIIRFFC